MPVHTATMSSALSRSVSLLRGAGQPPLVVAHRGASGHAPENTMAAFRLAIEMGAPAVECDVHLTADNHLVVIHDATVDRTTSGSGPVAALMLAELQALDAGEWFSPRFQGERLPTFEETLALCRGRARLFVELKAGGGTALAEAAVKALQNTPAEGVAVISFDAALIQAVSKARPDVPCGLLRNRLALRLKRPAQVALEARAAGATLLGPEAAGLRALLVSAAHQAGLGVSVWTVDDPEAMRRLADTGVDAITTNFPDRALALFPAGRAESAC